MSSLFFKRQFLTTAASVLLSIFVVALMAYGASVIDTDSIGVGTSTPGAGLYVHGGLSTVLSNDAYIYGQLNLAYLVATSTTASSFAGSLGVGTTTPGSTTLGVNEGWTSVLSGDAYIYGQLNLPYLVATSSTASSFAGNVGFGSTTPASALGVEGAGVFSGFVSANYFTSTSSLSSWLLGKLGLGTTTPSAELNDDGGLAVEGSAIIGDTLTVSTLKSTSTTDVIFAGAIQSRESATSTFVGGVNVTTTGGLSSATGLTVTGGDILSSGALKITSTATSTVAGGVTIDTDTLLVDSSSNRVAVGTTTLPATAAGDAIDFTVSSAATSTLFLANEAAGGSQIILKSTDGSGCVSIMATRGASALDAPAVLSVKFIACPE